MADKTTTTDVLVVGAGPTGMICAAELARGKVAARIIDKEPQPPQLAKALAVLPRSLEIYADMGVLDRFVALGRRLRGITCFPGGGQDLYLDFEALASRCNYIITLQQNRSEEILADLVADHGLVIERGVELVGLEEVADGVVAELRHRNGTVELCKATWLVGCDGAHSATRKLAEIPYDGYPLENTFMFVDAKVQWDLEDDSTHPMFSTDGVVLVIPHPEPGYWRVVVDLPVGSKPPDGLPLEIFQDLVNRRTSTGARLSAEKWKTWFTIRQNKARCYRKGHILIAGDAAHSHSPVGGQGMNTGIQDAHNLAWKLALVVRGRASPELLDSYDREREPVARAVLDFTEKLTRVACMRGWFWPRVRTALVNAVIPFGVAQRYGATLLGGLRTQYAESSVVRDDTPGLIEAALAGQLPGSLRRFRAGPCPGSRAPHALLDPAQPESSLLAILRQQKHHLLLFSDPSDQQISAPMRQLAASLAHDFDDVMNIYIVAPRALPHPSLVDGAALLFDRGGELRARYHADRPCMFVLRPDGFLGYRNPVIDEARLRRYLDGVFRACRPAPPAVTRIEQQASV
jgi:2-polyprenyl-6-methoxyphenol hydroxylase-like FAD-dependent oxidoreductase